MKVLDKIIIVLTNVFLLIIAAFIITVPLTGSKNFYLYEFEKNNTSINTGYSEEELGDIADSIINFLMDKSDNMQIIINNAPVFSNQAINHMKDVKDLYIGGQKIAIIAVVLFVICCSYLIIFHKRLRDFLFKYSAITIGVFAIILLLFAIFAIIDFNNAFIFFHKVIFPDEQKFRDAFFGSISNYNELPGINNQMLVLILDEQLFMDCGLIIGGFVLTTEVIWFVFLYYIKKKGNKKIPN